MDLEFFSGKLTIALANELRFWRDRLFSEQIRAFNLGCYPWHGYLELSFLTTNEHFVDNDDAKWMVGDWRWYDFTSGWNSKWEQAEELAKWINEYYENSANAKKAADEIFRACAKAVTSPEVEAELKKYSLTDDFEVSVFNGDEKFPQKNYCVLVEIDN